jgi:HSP20 family protein
LKVAVDGRRVTPTTVAAAAGAASEKAAEPAVDAKPAERALYRERAKPVFARTVALPVEVDQQASQARFENGVLTLVLAKKIAAGATQLQIA